jgi:endonuclease/exonuclease/phosphatase (EEP) superfamily protein YafD
MWLTSLGLALLYPIRWLSGDSLDLIRAVSYVTPWLILFVLFMAILAGLARRIWLALALAIPAVAIGFTFVPLFLPNRQTVPPPNSLTLKVMSFNLHYIQETSGVLEIIRQEDPDILLLQELNPAAVGSLLDELRNVYPRQGVDVVNQVGSMNEEEIGFNQAILSRFPVKHISAEFDKGRAQKVVIETPLASIAVWNVHPLPPFLFPPEWHDSQISRLATDIAATTGPLIVGGDFNATDQSITYQAISRHLKNAYQQAGQGLGFGYPAPPYTFMDLPLPKGPLWRIDHIFYSQDFTANSARTVTNGGGSDHFPMVAELSLVK